MGHTTAPQRINKCLKFDSSFLKRVITTPFTFFGSKKYDMNVVCKFQFPDYSAFLLLFFHKFFISNTSTSTLQVLHSANVLYTEIIQYMIRNIIS